MALIERCVACATESIHTQVREAGEGSIDMELVPGGGAASDPNHSTRSIRLLQYPFCYRK